MSDASARAEFEQLQVGNPKLARALADFPARSEARLAVEGDNEVLRDELERLEQRLATSEASERQALDERDRQRRAEERLRGLWWMSRFAPVAVVLGLAVSFKTIGWLLDSIHWPYWSERLGPWLLPLVPLVNLARLGLSRWQRRRRAGRPLPTW